MRTLPNVTFDTTNVTKIYELITYFPFSSRISLYKNRNISLNILILKLMSASKNTGMKETVINSLKNSS